VKKIVWNNGKINTTTYIGGIFEYHTEGTTNHLEEKTNNTLHLTEDADRFALIRVGAPFDGADDGPAVQYQLGDHLGNVHFVVNENGNFHSREEHYPYGGTSFGSFAKKRYRFTGKERDEESGLNYHSARYYAPWMKKWVSADPAGMVDGMNLYGYGKGNPKTLIDTNGENTEKKVESWDRIARAVRRGILLHLVEKEYAIWKKHSLEAEASKADRTKLKDNFQVLDDFIGNPEGHELDPGNVAPVLAEVGIMRKKLMHRKIGRIQSNLNKRVTKLNNRAKNIATLLDKRKKWNAHAKAFAKITDDARKFGGPSVPGTGVGLQDAASIAMGNFAEGGMGIGFSIVLNKRLNLIDKLITEYGRTMSDRMFETELLRERLNRNSSFSSIKEFNAEVKAIKKEAKRIRTGGVIRAKMNITPIAKDLKIPVYHVNLK